MEQPEKNRSGIYREFGFEIATKPAYLLALLQVLNLVIGPFRGKIMAKIDRMNYHCPEVVTNVKSNQRIRAQKFS